MPNPFYVFTIKHEGLAIELWLNDVLLDKDPEGAFRNRKFINNLYILDGENSLKVKISLPGVPPKMPESPELRIAVHEVDADALGEEQLPDPIVELLFPGNEPPTFPAELETAFTVTSPFGRWAWEDSAPVNADDPAEVAACADVVSRMYDSLTARDIDGIAAIVDVKTREVARAYYMDMDQRVASQRAFFEEIFGDAQFEMEPLKKNELVLRPMGKNRLVLIEHADGTPALESKELSEGYCFTLPAIASKIDGEWKVVR